MISFIISFFLNMARRKLEDKNIRKIQKSGNGAYHISIPIEIVRKMKLRERQRVVVKQFGNSIKILV